MKHLQIPKTKIELSSLDYLLEVISFLGLAVIWFLVVSNYSNLSETIRFPMSYKFRRDAEYYNKNLLLAIPILASLLLIGFSILNKYPHKFNYKIQITEENKEQEYTKAMRLIRYIKYVISIILGIFTCILINENDGKTYGADIGFVILCLGLIFIPAIYSFMQDLKS